MPSGGRIQPEPTPRPLEREEQERPWAVFIHNDDVTPMEFVVHILLLVFELPTPNAILVMQTAHLSGRAYVQSLPRNEACRRIGQGRFAARLRGFPLEFSLAAE